MTVTFVLAGVFAWQLGPVLAGTPGAVPKAQHSVRGDLVPDLRQELGSQGMAPAPLEGGRPRSRKLVLVLHGGSFRPRSPRDLAERALAPLTDDAERLGLRLLAPVAPSSWLSGGYRASSERSAEASDPATLWASPAGETLVLHLIAEELRQKRADPRRIYLAGHGAGATSALELAARHPQLFAGLALWSGTPAPLWQRGDGAAQGASVASVEPKVVGLVGDPVPALATVPVYLWTGAQDGILDRKALAMFVQQMQGQLDAGAGHVFQWTEQPGAHDYGPQGPGAGLQFLRDRKKAKPRKAQGSSR